MGWRGRKFATEVREVRIREGVLEQFFDDRKEVVEGANEAERRRIRGACEAANRGQQEGSFDDGERDLAVKQLAGEAMIVTAEAAGCFGQAEIESCEGAEVGFMIVWHGSFFLTFFFGQ